MSTREYEFILMIAKEKNLSRAADKLFISQPALSLFLSRLESELGVNLFERTKNGLELTTVGQRYLQMAKAIMQTTKEFQNDLMEINAGRKGILKIGTSAHIGSIILPSVISEFHQAYPKVELVITEGRSKELEMLIYESRVDLAFMHAPFKLVHTRYEKIFEDRYLVAIHRENPVLQWVYHEENERYPYIDIKMLARQKFILAFPEQRVRQISDQILMKAEVIPDILLATSSVQTALQFCGKNLGVTLIPESYLQLFRYSEDIILCSIEKKYDAFWTFCVVYPDQFHLSGPVKMFSHITKKIFGSLPESRLQTSANVIQ
ncbi:MAG: LysR family transcriptional regulator [Hungatella sp.]|nr:LysR family transcriptional regulator [Hungatella sp.]